MDEFKGSPTSLVADVDCTAEGKSLCEKFSIGGYPSIKYGDPAEMKDYNGGRTFDDLKKFASENLGPTCGPANLDLCDAAARKKIEGYMAMPAEKLDAKIEKATKSFEMDVPVMRKVIGHLKAKSDL
mmetsp:Transcript_99482/g.257117  ORF Transcript_99482/g.257117 Transcript_99482/m.257117 type:complete len:127 (+) Transcript_99482:257-637(+)